jgi:hypothetical protein
MTFIPFSDLKLQELVKNLMLHFTFFSQLIACIAVGTIPVLMSALYHSRHSGIGTTPALTSALYHSRHSRRTPLSRDLGVTRPHSKPPSDTAMTHHHHTLPSARRSAPPPVVCRRCSSFSSPPLQTQHREKIVQTQTD